MKNSYVLPWLTVLLLVFIKPSQASFIIDTGTPSALNSAISLSNAQWLAAEFSLSRDRQISSLEVYITADTANPNPASFTVALYANSLANLPDTNAELFAQQVVFAGDGWNGVFGLNVDLSAGNYWLALEVRDTDNLAGLLPVNPSQTLPSAVNDNTGNFGYTAATGSNYAFGVRIDAVPEPSVLLLLATSLSLIGFFNRQKSNKLPD